MDKITQFRFKYLGVGLVLFFIFVMLDLELLALISAVGIVGVLYAFRDPEIELHRFEEGSIVAPNDGVVREITMLEDGNDYGVKITIESSYKDISLLRVPCDAKVESFTIVHGTRVCKKSSLFTLLNENGEVVFQDKEGGKIKVQHRLKRSFAPLFFDLNTHKEVLQTARYGVAFNAVVTLYLPKGYSVVVDETQRVKSAESVLATRNA
jgi:hypothetical protein